jgi:hypothetical protein
MYYELFINICDEVTQFFLLFFMYRVKVRIVEKLSSVLANAKITESELVNLNILVREDNWSLKSDQDFVPNSISVIFVCVNTLAIDV